MSKLCVKSFAISIDGFGAGLGQDLNNPLGVKGPELMGWFFHTRMWREMYGEGNGETGIGAWIIGRNMFGPVRGAWPDESWKWGTILNSIGGQTAAFAASGCCRGS